MNLNFILKKEQRVEFSGSEVADCSQLHTKLVSEHTVAFRGPNNVKCLAQFQVIISQ